MQLPRIQQTKIIERKPFSEILRITEKAEMNNNHSIRSFHEFFNVLLALAEPQL